MYIDWGTKVIHVAKSDMVLIQSTPTEIRQLDLDWFRKKLNDLQDDEEGIAYPTTHNHVAPISVGGVELARVIEILVPYTVTFEDGQYAVNLVGANSNVADRTNVNQVSVRSANSAGLPHLEAIQSGAFNGVVTVKEGTPYQGTQYPVGVSSYPVNNIPDARKIMELYALTKLQIVGDWTFSSGDDISYIPVSGQGATISRFVLESGADTYGSIIQSATITGILDGGAILERCVIEDVDYFNGFLHKCLLKNRLSLIGTNAANLLSCYSGIPGTTTPVIDMNGDGSSNTPLALRDYNGGIKLINKTGDAECSVDLVAGQVIIDSTCTNGTIVVRGTGKVIDEYGNEMDTGTYNGNLHLINETVTGVFVRKIYEANFMRRKWDKAANTITIYDNDGITPLYVFDTNSDMSEIIPR